MVGVDDGESAIALLKCEACAGTTRVAMDATDGRRIVTCEHCGASIYWHECAHCGLQYVGKAETPCAVCEGNDLEDLQIG
jgi:hypothetical protein